MNADDPLRTIHNIARKIETDEQQALIKAPPLVDSNPTPRATLMVGASGDMVVINFGQPILGGAIALPAEEASALAAAIARQAHAVSIARARKRHRNKKK